MQATPQRAAATAVDAANRDLVELAARFATGFKRRLDHGGAGGFTYPRLRVLESLHCDGSAMMRTLADRLGLSARHLTAVADGLEADGLLRRVAHPDDRRATILELTDAGWGAADAALQPRLAEIGELFDELDPDTRPAFREALETLVAAMETGCPKDPDCEV
jgi:DNA-binding MarR family transcriptional regulator